MKSLKLINVCTHKKQDQPVYFKTDLPTDALTAPQEYKQKQNIKRIVAL